MGRTRGRVRPLLRNKLSRPCRIENKACWAGAIPGQQAIHTLPGLEKKLVGQEPSPVNKLFIPCRIENKACGAGSIPGQQAIQTLPDLE